MKCPSCSAEGPDEAAECTACGVNYAKWKAKVEKAAAEAAAAPPPEPPPPPRSTLKTTLGVLAAASVAVYTAYDVASRRIAPPEETGGVLVRPDAYRPRIQALEAALYKKAPPTHADVRTISDAASQLAGAVLERHPQNPFARSAIGDLLEFSGAVAAAEEGMTMLPTARLDWTRRWESVRARRFAKAPWFHKAVTAAEGPPPDFERAAARILSAGHRLKTLLAGVPAEFEKFSVDDVNLADKERDAGRAAAEIEAWRAWRTDWQGRVDEALTGFPEPDEIPAELQFTYDTLVRSAQETRTPPNPGPGVVSSGKAVNEVYQPGKPMRDAWLAGLAEWLSGLDESIKGARAAKLNPTKE
ncbi:MAG: hypothetical protein FD126_1118 [Elusimicrobia bacterium]|nr:MAG: hypothetical protein FD126_1118 [Elusimicrobiota bacterium]